MKMHQFKNIVSVVCFIIAGFCLAMSVTCAAEWSATLEATISAIVFVLYLLIGLCAKKGATEDYENYIYVRKITKEDYYDRLSYLFKKHYWTLDVDKLIPSFHDKKLLLEWAADVAVACQAYQHDYSTKEKAPIINHELEQMIELANQLIENKKYI